MIEPSAQQNCLLAHLSMTDIVWAAGFFDGEGSTVAHVVDRVRGYLRLDVTVPQHGGALVPAVLTRFQAAVLGLGRIVGPDDLGRYRWESRSFGEGQATIALLWRYLGQVKRAQATRAIRAYLGQYASGKRRARPTRFKVVSHDVHARAGALIPPPAEIERIWAAGFFDAEGCFGVARWKPRKRGPAWYRIRASATQHGETGIPAQVLLRLRTALDGMGRIECHGEADDFRWLVEGEERIQQVLIRIGPWLGDQKREQAAEALARFRAQVRLKGDQMRCVRGHAYTRVGVRGGRLRRVCNPCERITSRMRRAAQGIRPRQFKNIARIYTL